MQLLMCKHQVNMEWSASLPFAFCCSKHNDNTWNLPGGNQEEGDDSLLGTATREAMEELGQVPPFELKSQILTT